jgi:broad specificity phosphatase PhoE
MSVLRLVRHGQASFGKRNYDALSKTGHQQARILGEALAHRGTAPDLIISGEMRRHAETAEGIVAGLGSEVEVIVDPGWDEFDFQHVVEVHRPLYRSRTAMMADLVRQRKPRDAFQRVFEEATRKWVDGDGDYHETFAAFSARVSGALANAATQGHRAVLVVSSGGPIALAASELLVADGSLWATLNRVAVNTAVTKVISGSRGLTLASYNEHTHLEHDRALITYR